jgi:hypothetical protein
MAEKRVAAPVAGNLLEQQVRRCHKAFVKIVSPRWAQFKVRSMVRHGTIVTPQNRNASAWAAGNEGKQRFTANNSEMGGEITTVQRENDALQNNRLDDRALV